MKRKIKLTKKHWYWITTLLIVITTAVTLYFITSFLKAYSNDYLIVYGIEISALFQLHFLRKVFEYDEKKSDEK